MNYTKIYNSLVSNRKEMLRSKRDAVYERHHILPKSLGGTDDSENLVLLTPREHYIAHWLLVKIYAGPSKAKMAYAFLQMARGSNSRGTGVSSRQFDRTKQELSKYTKGSFHPNWGKSKPMSEEHKIKIGNSLRGVEKSDAHKKSLSESFKGKPKTMTEANALRLKILSAGNVGRVQPKVICPHCGKEGGVSPMKRFHFNNCKFKTGESGRI